VLLLAVKNHSYTATVTMKSCITNTTQTISNDAKSWSSSPFMLFTNRTWLFHTYRGHTDLFTVTRIYGTIYTKVYL